jgi:hypothetical protein
MGLLKRAKPLPRTEAWNASIRSREESQATYDTELHGLDMTFPGARGNPDHPQHAEYSSQEQAARSRLYARNGEINRARGDTLGSLNRNLNGAQFR